MDEIMQTPKVLRLDSHDNHCVRVLVLPSGNIKLAAYSVGQNADVSVELTYWEQVQLRDFLVAVIEE